MKVAHIGPPLARAGGASGYLLQLRDGLASNRRGWEFAARFRLWLRPRTLSAWDEVHTLWGTTDSSGR